MDLGPHKASYSISKAALHMLTYKQAKACPEMIVLSVHPASVKTDMGPDDAEFEAPHVAAEMIQLLQRWKRTLVRMSLRRGVFSFGLENGDCDRIGV
ncbi:hypothetical protein OPQ81_008534 [Rhizoctonia solani]|nr:hypothetical protein OPQ81_008534 [Rhizoctonia solani]